jgi:hypothetical protein
VDSAAKFAAAKSYTSKPSAALSVAGKSSTVETSTMTAAAVSAAPACEQRRRGCWCHCQIDSAYSDFLHDYFLHCVQGKSPALWEFRSFLIHK